MAIETSANDTQGQDIASQATTNRKPGSIVDVAIECEDFEFYLDPHLMEIIAVPMHEVHELEKEMSRLAKVAHEALEAKEWVAKLIQERDELLRKRLPNPTLLKAVGKRIDTAFLNLQKKLEAQKNEIKAIGPNLANNDARLMELVPISKQISTNQDRQRQKFQNGRIFTYIHSTRRKPHWRRIKIDPTCDKESASKAFLVKLPDGKTRLDKDKLKASMKAIKIEEKEHASWEKKSEWLWFETLKWVGTLNEDDKSRHFDLSGEAALMRWTAGAAAYYSPKLGDLRKGKFAARINGQAQFALAEAKGSANLYFPNVSGWMWKWTFDSGGHKDVFDMGAVRCALHVELSGTVGVSLMAELGVEINLKDGKTQAIKGTPANAKSTLTASVDASKEEAEEPQKKGIKSGGQVEAFAGARATAEIAGTLEWQKPQSTEFEAFAKIAPTFEGQAGIGATASLEISYIDGKFHFHAKAALCFGLGAKGKVLYEVDAKLMKEFALWFYHQLYNSDFRMLKFMGARAFEAYCYLSYLAIIKGVEIGFHVVESISRARANIAAWLLHWHRNEQEILTLTHRIICDPGKVLTSPPEVQGALIHQLIDDRIEDGAHVRQKRREAVMQILRCLRTRRQYDNMLQHMTSNMTQKVDPLNSEDRIWRFFASPQEEFFEFFTGQRAPKALQKKSDSQRTWAEQFVALIHRLPFEPSPGWIPCLNSHPAFDMQQGTHPMFNRISRDIHGSRTEMA